MTKKRHKKYLTLHQILMENIQTTIFKMKNLISMSPNFANESENSNSEFTIPLHPDKLRTFRFGSWAAHIVATCFKFEPCKSNLTRFGKYKWFTDVTSIVFDSISSMTELFIATIFPVQTFSGVNFSNSKCALWHYYERGLSLSWKFVYKKIMTFI